MTTEKEIQEMVESLLERLCLNGSTQVIRKEESYLVQISSDEGSLLIGQNGGNILALQHILRLLMRKNEIKQSLYLDVNNYWKEKEALLISDSQKNAEEVLKGAQERIILRPMNAHERKIVHSAISLIPGVRTESVSDGYERRVQIIKEEVS